MRTEHKNDLGLRYWLDFKGKNLTNEICQFDKWFLDATNEDKPFFELKEC